MNTEEKKLKEAFSSYEIKTSADDIKKAYLLQQADKKAEQASKPRSFFSLHKKSVVAFASILGVIGVSLGTFFAIRAALAGNNVAPFTPDKDFASKKEKTSYQIVSALSLGDSAYEISKVRRSYNPTFEVFSQAVNAYKGIEDTINSYFDNEGSYAISSENGSFLGTYGTYANKITIGSATAFLYNGNIEDEEEKEDDEEETEQSIEGEVSVDGGTAYKVSGESETEGTAETELELTLFYSEKDYIIISNEAEQGELEYSYEVYKDDSLVEKIEIEQNHEKDGSLVYEVALEKGEQSYSFVIYQADPVKVEYSFSSNEGYFNIKTNDDGIRHYYDDANVL